MGLFEFMITMSVIGIALSVMWGPLGILSWLVLFIVLAATGDENG